MYTRAILRSQRVHTVGSPLTLSGSLQRRQRNKRVSKIGYAVSRIGIRFGRSQINADSEK